jgi:transposase-like protein
LLSLGGFGQYISAIKEMLAEGVGIDKTARTLRVGNGTVQRISREMRGER